MTDTSLLKVQKSTVLNNRAIELSTKHWNPIYIAEEKLLSDIVKVIPMDTPGYFEKEVIQEHGMTTVTVRWIEIKP